MTSLAHLLAELEIRGIILFLDRGEVRYRSPRDALTEADRMSLRARKTEIAAFLQAREAGRALRAPQPMEGPLTPSVVQEMWWRFAGGPREGEPIALNIGMVGNFHGGAEALTEAVHQVIARHAALRVGFQADGKTLKASLSDPSVLIIGQEDLRELGDDAEATAMASAREFCGRLNPILSPLLTRAKVIALPNGRSMAVISSAHMIADFGSRNIVIDELQDILDGKSVSPSIPYNEYALGERAFLETPAGEDLIGYWRDWYTVQPTLVAPSAKIPLLWGNGTRTVRNFAIPRAFLEQAGTLADRLKVTPFSVYLTIFCITLARWSGASRFPVRVLGDKRTTLALSGTVGLMFCADAVAVQVPQDSDFETVLRGIVTEYEATLARRIPSLHFYAPQMVRPGIEPKGFANRIPAVFNYYSVGTARERMQKHASPAVPLPWPPHVELVSQSWPRVSSPIFLHLMDHGGEASISLHFYADVIGDADQDSFTRLLFQIFSDVLAA